MKDADAPTFIDTDCCLKAWLPFVRFACLGAGDAWERLSCLRSTSNTPKNRTVFESVVAVGACVVFVSSVVCVWL